MLQSHIIYSYIHYNYSHCLFLHPCSHQSPVTDLICFHFLKILNLLLPKYYMLIVERSENAVTHKEDIKHFSQYYHLLLTFYYVIANIF